MSEAVAPDPEFPAPTTPDPLIGTSKPRLLGILGPGLITGASDDDPSGIATYSQAGAQAGFALLWLMPFTYPLMAVTQEISARLGRTTGHGLAGNIRRHYPAWVAHSCIALLLIANVINLGADLGSMGDVVHMLAVGPSWLSLVVAVLGTTISPYLFFWQSSQEAEDQREQPRREKLTEAPEQPPPLTSVSGSTPGSGWLLAIWSRWQSS